MDDVCKLVVDKYDGSLKAEHGTGRNMAPFVEMEWGRQADRADAPHQELFDPDLLLNPGVILNDDPQAHLQILKPMPAAEDIVDRCIECGFCEPLCPSHRLTLSPRQRIVSWRELSRRAAAGEEGGQDRRRLSPITASIPAPAAACAPPLARSASIPANSRAACADAGWDSLRGKPANGRLPISARSRPHRGSGCRLGMRFPACSATTWSGGCPAAPGSAACRRPENRPLQRSNDGGDPVVYFPACGGRIFGANSAGEATLPEVVMTLLTRAGYAPRLPEGFDKLCCGQMLASKGMADEATQMADAVMRRAIESSRRRAGRSTTRSSWMPALARCACKSIWRAVCRCLTSTSSRMTRCCHVCGSRAKPGRSRCISIAACAARASDAQVARARGSLRRANRRTGGRDCCGFGGDRGFVVPELNVHALRKVHDALPENCCEGVSTNRTCEIGLTAETGRVYSSVAYLLEECSRADSTGIC